MIGSIPISVIERSEKLMRILQGQVERISETSSDVYIADFAAGENDEIPLYFHTYFSKTNLDTKGIDTLYVYCTDTHSLRVESLFGELHFHGVTERTRVVVAKLETMDMKADFPSIQADYFKGPNERTRIDDAILVYHRIPEESFHIGILNNDVVGYLHEYYKEYSNAERSLLGIRKAMHIEGLLIVTQPCKLYPIDNIEIIERNGFQYIAGFDFDIKENRVSDIDRNASAISLSRLGHYTVLLFKCR